MIRGKRVLKILLAGIGVSPLAHAQLWSSVDVVTKADVRFQAEVSREHNCLTKFELSYRGKRIVVPEAAKAGICNVLLEDTKLEPDEPSINIVHDSVSIATGFKLTLTTLPRGKPDDIIDEHQYVRYDFGFDETCLTSRTKTYWRNGKRAHDADGDWTCGAHGAVAPKGPIDVTGTVEEICAECDTADLVGGGAVAWDVVAVRVTSPQSISGTTISVRVLLEGDGVAQKKIYPLSSNITFVAAKSAIDARKVRLHVSDIQAAPETNL